MTDAEISTALRTLADAIDARGEKHSAISPSAFSAPEPTTVEWLTATALEGGMAIVGGAVAQRDAAVLLRVSFSTLRRWRDEGRGPPWSRRGSQIFYRLGDLADFLERGEPDQYIK